MTYEVGNRVHVKSFMLESKDNPEGIDSGEIVHIEKAFIPLGWIPPVTVELDNGDQDNHKYMRFHFKELTKEEN